MEHGLFLRFRDALRSIGRRRPSLRHSFTDAGILEVYLWAALHDRPVCWACDPAHWPPKTRRGPMPSPSTVSRRMRTKPVLALLDRLQREFAVGEERWPVAAVDGKAMAIAPHSHDRQSGYGWATGAKGRGYKLHAIVGATGELIAWRIAPLQRDESKMARRMLGELDGVIYLLGDTGYDKNHLYDAALERGIELRAPRKAEPGAGMGHHYHSPARYRSRETLEDGVNGFGRDLMKLRGAVERYFSDLCSGPCGLGHLPAWVRGWRRVRNWVAAKLTILTARRALRREALMQ